MKTSYKDRMIDEILKGNEFPDGDIFDLGLHTSYEVRKYVRARWYNNIPAAKLGKRKGALTRKAKRIWKLIGSAVHRQRQAGGIGIYKIKIDYTEELGHVYATSPQEAERLVQIFFGYLIPPFNTSGKKPVVSVEFFSYDGAMSLGDLNLPLASNLERKIDDHERSIKVSHKKIEKLKAKLETLRMVEGQQISVENAIEKKMAKTIANE
jgi:hypothetical protein